MFSAPISDMNGKDAQGAPFRLAQSKPESQQQRPMYGPPAGMSGAMQYGYVQPAFDPAGQGMQYAQTQQPPWPQYPAQPGAGSAFPPAVGATMQPFQPQPAQASQPQQTQTFQPQPMQAYQQQAVQTVQPQAMQAFQQPVQQPVQQATVMQQPMVAHHAVAQQAVAMQPLNAQASQPFQPQPVQEVQPQPVQELQPALAAIAVEPDATPEEEQQEDKAWKLPVSKSTATNIAIIALVVIAIIEVAFIGSMALNSKSDGAGMQTDAPAEVGFGGTLTQLFGGPLAVTGSQDDAGNVESGMPDEASDAAYTADTMLVPIPPEERVIAFVDNQTAGRTPEAPASEAVSGDASGEVQPTPAEPEVAAQSTLPAVPDAAAAAPEPADPVQGADAQPASEAQGAFAATNNTASKGASAGEIAMYDVLDGTDLDERLKLAKLDFDILRVSDTSRSFFVMASTAKVPVGENLLVFYTNLDLCIARNEIYARHGCIFQNEDLQHYFDQQQWYCPIYSREDVPDFDTLLNDTERENLRVIKAEEEKRKSPLQGDRPFFRFL